MAEPAAAEIPRKGRQVFQQHVHIGRVELLERGEQSAGGGGDIVSARLWRHATHVHHDLGTVRKHGSVQHELRRQGTSQVDRLLDALNGERALGVVRRAKVDECVVTVLGSMHHEPEGFVAALPGSGSRVEVAVADMELHKRHTHRGKLILERRRVEKTRDNTPGRTYINGP